MISPAPETGRTLFFDFSPSSILGTVPRFQDPSLTFILFPGQSLLRCSRKLILSGVDGIVFVADSQEQRMDANVEALKNLMSRGKHSESRLALHRTEEEEGVDC
jgi:hypothetical protein